MQQLTARLQAADAALQAWAPDHSISALGHGKIEVATQPPHTTTSMSTELSWHVLACRCRCVTSQPNLCSPAFSVFADPKQRLQAAQASLVSAQTDNAKLQEQLQAAAPPGHEASSNTLNLPSGPGSLASGTDFWLAGPQVHALLQCL